MKIKFIIISQLLFLSFVLSAQNLKKRKEDYYPERVIVPHSFGSRTIDLKYMETKEGFGLQSTYTKINKNSTLSNYTLGWDKGNLDMGGTKYNIVSLDYAMLYNFYNLKRKFFTNVGSGVYTALETTKNDILDKSNTSFAAGILITLECEYYYKRFALVGAFDQIYKPVSDIGKWQWRGKLGIRYYL